MAAGELYISEISMEWKVDVRNKSRVELYSSEFQFNNAGWKLFFYYDCDCLGEYDLHLELEKCSGDDVISPFYTSVRVKEEDQDETEGSQVKVFTKQFNKEGSSEWIWWKEADEEKVLRAVPEFPPYAVLELVLQVAKSATGDPSSTKSTSVQTTLLTVPCLESLSQPKLAIQVLNRTIQELSALVAVFGDIELERAQSPSHQ